jgi:hypothetical protein
MLFAIDRKATGHGNTEIAGRAALPAANVIHHSMPLLAVMRPEMERRWGRPGSRHPGAERQVP